MKNEARVLTLAGKYGADAFKRLRRVKGYVRTSLVEHDALSLAGGGSGTTTTLAKPRQEFEFVTQQGKERAFMDWFNDAMDDELLEPVGTDRVERGNHWTAKYVRGGQRSGLRDAGSRLREKDVEPQFARGDLEDLFDMPITTDQLATLYQRNFAALKDITEEVGEQVSQELTHGLSEGHNPRKVARSINERIDNVGITRARTLARTELSRSYNNASVLRYRRNGIEKVNVQNTSPCEICAAVIADNPYPVEEAEGLIPASTHPVCVCSLSPVTVMTGA